VLAIANAHYDLAAFLLDQGADPNQAKQGWTALHQVVRMRNLNIGFFPQPEASGEMSTMALAKKVIAHGVDVNARQTKAMRDGYRNSWFNELGATALLIASKGADAEMMRFLVANGADATLTNVNGTTPLMLASGIEMYNQGEDSGTLDEALEAVKVALQIGADVNLANKRGETPLHGAAYRGSNEIVQLLVDHGAALDAKTQGGMTPLMIANGEDYRVPSFLIRPATVALLQQLLRDRGLPADLSNPDERYRFEKQPANFEKSPARQ